MAPLHLKSRRTLLPMAVLCIFLISCSGGNSNKAGNDGELKGTVTVSGAFALYPMTVKWAEEFRLLNPGVRIDISAGGAGKGLADALSGMVDLGMFSREVTQAEISQGTWYIAVANDGVVPTVHPGNPVFESLMEKGLKQSDFEHLFLDDSPHYWEDLTGGTAENRVNVYTRSDACGAAEMWGRYLGRNQESLKGVGVFGDPGMADAIKHDPLGIGYNNMVYAYDMGTRQKFPGLEIVPIDLDNDGRISEGESFYGTLDDLMEAIQSGKYPSPPARDLYFVSRGKPSNPAAVAFLQWILTEGQQYVSQAGYIRLSSEKISMELDKLR